MSSTANGRKDECAGPTGWRDPRDLREVSIDGETVGGKPTRRSVTVNRLESPLGWLVSRGHLTERQFLAGERLRIDWERAQRSQRTTMAWDVAPVARTRGGSPSAPDLNGAQLDAKERFEAAIAADRGGADVTIDGQVLRVESDWTPGGRLARLSVGGRALVLKVGKITHGFRVRTRGADLRVHVRTPRQAELAALMPVKAPADTSRLLLCPMPGLVVRVEVSAGDEVQEGQALAVVEAMKMENVLRAERRGRVARVAASAGDSLAVDDVILEFE